MKKAIILLNKKGLKMTPQRIKIIDYLQHTKTHPSAEELFEVLKRDFPSISFATVYNTLLMLKNSGDIKELSIDPERKRFDMDTTPHHHFFCKMCKKVYDVALPENTNFSITNVEEHIVYDISLYLTGICNKCKINNKKEDKRDGQN